MKRTLLEASIPEGQDARRAKAYRAKILITLRTLNLSASIKKNRLRVYVYVGGILTSESRKEVESVRWIISRRLGLEICNESTE